MGKEIERKWLINEFPANLVSSNLSSKINQMYLEVSNENDEVRLRKKGDRYFLTVKKGEGLEREETQIEIPFETYNSLSCLQVCKNKIRKTRYEIKDGSNIIELDFYEGNLERLVTAEVEFGSIEESKSYNPPEWFGKEITEEKKYKNKNLARDGIPKN